MGAPTSRYAQPIQEQEESIRVGKRIAEARRETGLTQTELARRIGVPLYVVERYEAGDAAASEHLEAIARITATPLSSFESSAVAVAGSEALGRLEAELAQLRAEVDERLMRLEELVH